MNLRERLATAASFVDDAVADSRRRLGPRGWARHGEWVAAHVQASFDVWLVDLVLRGYRR